ncbi:MAG: undecaprenyl-diphosphatase UppP [Bryobacteraceae bacterium]|nr:undecaprenyl-diphosphatase UppP [Bryobacteraceae bacterium]
MPIHQAVILAIVQGLTEFLPISSSAHLALAPWLLGWKDQGLTFDIALHFGTLSAVLIYFFKDWVQIIGQAFGWRGGADAQLRMSPKLLWTIAAATLPIGILGLLFKDAAETTLRSPWVIGTMLILVGLLMLWAEKFSRREKGIGRMTFADAMTIGFAQALAIIPGTSRSGITITAGLFRHIDREAAARFSFLLSTPAIGAAALLAFKDLHEAGGVPSAEIPSFITGIVVSALTGSLVIGLLLKYLRSHSLRFFVAYRIIFGILVLALAFFRR